jgi:ribosomal protein S18 acetylase RimI-like enzyme
LKVASLAYRTDLVFHAFDGRISDHGDHLVIESPSNPGFYWGNFLLFAARPTLRDVERWPAIFAGAFAHAPGVRHFCFGWDQNRGSRDGIEGLQARGFSLEQGDVLTASRPHPPPRPNREVVVRALSSDADWEAATQNQIATRGVYELAGYTVFKRAQMARYRAMTAAGLGAWMGAFLEEQLVGDLGVFVQEGVGRFQSVGTHPDFRRRGVCATLVHQAARFARASLAARELVIVAEADGDAGRIYRSLGFRPTATQEGLVRRPPATQAPEKR